MDGPPPPEEDFSQLPVADRLAHKNWKARVSAYESLVKTFQTTASDSDPAFKPYINNPDTLKKIATDANAVAQEKGLECLVAFVKFAGENAARTREVVMPALVEKCFGSARAGTKAQAIELSLQYVEVENSAAGVGVGTSILIPGLTSLWLPGVHITRFGRKATQNCRGVCGCPSRDCQVSPFLQTYCVYMSLSRRNRQTTDSLARQSRHLRQS